MENAYSSKTITIGYDDNGIYHLINGKKVKQDLERNGTERVFRFSLISRQLRWLQGEILTIVEASIDNPQKLEAVKELIKDKISSKISWIYELCGTPEEEQDGLEYPESFSQGGRARI